MDKGTTVASCAGLLAAALFAISCTESVGPERGGPGTPSFSFSPNGITLNRAIGTLNQSGRLLIKGFNPTNPHRGDAIIATFFWLGSTNIIDSVTDVLTTAPSYTPVGNRYTLVEYVTAGGYSMATYVATNVQNFPDPNTDPGQSDILAVGAHLAESVTDGGLTLSAWTGVEDNFTAALGDHRSNAGSDTTITAGHAGPIAINAGAVAYTVTMSGLFGLDRPQGYTGIGQGSSDNSIKQDGAYAVQANAGTVDPGWTWFFSPPGGTWLVTTLALNPGTSSTGNLTATTNTSGSNLDSDGYTVTVDGTTSQPIATNDSITGVTFTGLTASSHSVALAGVAANCTVTSANPQTVTVPSGGTVTAAFTVSCSATTGDLKVTTSTSGTSQDPDGYTVTVDGTTSQPIATNDSTTGVTFTGLAASSHSVALAGVAANCTVTSANPQTVTVPSGATVTAAFSVSCSALTGDLAVTTSTTGSSLDPDGYTVTVDDGSAQALGINASFTYTNLTAGDHTVAIAGVAANCTVSGGTSRTVSVPSGSTATTTFSVSCITPPGNLTVTTSTTGLSLDLDGYTVTVDGSQSRAIAINGSVTFTDLAAGSHTVVLSGVAVNCTVSGSNPRDVTVPSGATASTTFTVSCVPGPATRLVFSVQPSNTAPFATITPAVKVKAVDAQGNTVTSFTGQVTIAIGRNAGLLLPGTLAGTKTVSPLNGVATFSDLSIDQKGDGYTLWTTSSGLTGAESASFNIAVVCIGPLCL